MPGSLREQFRCRPKVEDRRLQLPRPLLDEGDVSAQEQRREFRRRDDAGHELCRRFDRQLTREFADADQNADVIDANLGDRPSFFRRGDLVNLRQHDRD
jgi:hypothetical protein